MERYLQQLSEDIESAILNVSFPYIENEINLWDIPALKEEEKHAASKNLQEWTGIKAEMLPPASKLTDEQVKQLLVALNKLLSAYNCHFVLQIQVPERIQYDTIRCNFNQDVKVLVWNMGFFEMCKPGTEHEQCTLGEYCQCKFYEAMFSQFMDEDLSPNEERARMLEIEIRHLKRKYDDDWMKYYPYHLDNNYDDEEGNPYNYGFDLDDVDDSDW